MLCFENNKIILTIVFRVPRDCPRVLINREKAGQRSGLMALMGVKGGLDFENTKTKRDVFWLGDCDDGCQLLAEKLGWSVSEYQFFYLTII